MNMFVKTVSKNFHIRTVHLDTVKVLFVHQLMHQWVVLKNNIKFYIKIYIYIYIKTAGFNVNFDIFKTTH
jgi:hypothetical protein